jgi:chromosome segregation ATPase
VCFLIYNRHKEEKELLKRQVKEFNEKYQTACKENCSLESQILELRSNNEEEKHKYELELKSWHDKHSELNRVSQTNKSSLDSFKDKVAQLTSANVSEHEKYQKAVKDLEDELKHNQYTSINSSKFKEQLEDESLRITTINKKLTQQLEEAKNEARKFRKERSKFVREIENLKKPTEFDKYLGKNLSQ